MPTSLRLEPVTQENVRAACKLKLRADQEDLVAPVAWSLADAYTMPGIAWPRLIYDAGRPVGFVMVAFNPGTNTREGPAAALGRTGQHGQAQARASAMTIDVPVSRRFPMPAGLSR